MRLLKLAALGLFLSFAWVGAASAQQVNPYCTQSTTPPYVWAPCNPNNALAVSASVSASITGFPGATPTTGTPISVTTGGVTGSLPAGAVVVAFNVGTTNTAYCKLGASSTTSDTAIPPASWFSFTVGAATQLTCITSTSTTTVNMVGGSGLPTGAGGGGGGGSSGAVFGPTAVGSANANPPVVIGGTITGAAGQNVAGAAVKAASTAAVATDTSLVVQENPGGPLYAAITGPTPAGTNRIGYISDDPCSQKIKLNAPFSTSLGGPVSIVALSGSTVIYVCAISAITDTAIKLSFIDGTGGSCAAAQHAIWGSTTAASGMSLAANGGFTMGSGNGSVGVTTAASAFCLLQSGTSLVSGNITYVQQ